MDSWPLDLPNDPVCFSVDVEWACDAVLADLVALFDEYGIRATFFVTHDGVATPGHEKAIHPNFRRNGDSYRALPRASERSDEEVYEHIVAATVAYAPGAKGVRGHSLHYDSSLLPIYRRHGIEYECSHRLPLLPELRPFWNQHDMIGIPSYYSDYFELLTGATRFDIARLRLDQPGLKVLDFHPNIVFANVPDEPSYLDQKTFYKDPERLLAARYRGRGIRSLLVDVLEYVTKRKRTVMTLGELNQLWRSRITPAWAQSG
jgi:peptidoglycan/xylan/chitin deacetylase (PgdA/CDA1 family)